MASWAEVAAKVFELRNGNGDAVKPVSTSEYYASAKSPISPRPTHSALTLDKLAGTGFIPADWEMRMTEYVKSL